MCVIYQLEPGQMPPKEQFENAVHNNWHSFGLVTKIDGKLEIIKQVPTSGETDPEEIWNLLEEKKQYNRYLHLRHNTAGGTNMENCHPFEVYSDDSGRQVVFMHNGTFYEYKSKTFSNGNWDDDANGKSDSLNFVEKVLVPLCSGDFGSGKSDLYNIQFQFLLSKLWPTKNRGVLISSDQDEALFLGDWKTIKPVESDKSTHFLASNNDYFDKVERGPEHTRRLLRQKELDELAKQAREKEITKIREKAPTILVQPLSSFRFDVKHQFFNLSESLCNFFNDWDAYDREHLVSIGYATKDELEDLYNHKIDCLTVMEYAFTDYACLYKEYLELEEKHDKATKYIATLVSELKKFNPDGEVKVG